MMEDTSGKLLVYASNSTLNEKRLKSINLAAEKMADMLKLNIEVVASRQNFTPIYVYYKNADDEPIPIYCNKGEESKIGEICKALRAMMFVLSFHPKHSLLKHMRKQIISFS